MQRRVYSDRFFSMPDVMILFLIATLIYGIVAIANESRSEFHAVTQIDLSVWALPYYTLLSGMRGVAAYLISLSFTLIVGYAAAKSRTAEKIIIPLLDILQSVPVLGFLPGLILGLVALFPRTNIGLELAAIIMIFTGQVWNMTFGYYASLKSIPSEFHEASTMMSLKWHEKLRRVELPFAAVNLTWNSLLSMAGGWFFLIPCEAMTLGENEYRLPGIGAYMDVAIKEGDTKAMSLAVVAMVLLIVLMDFAIWRPLLAWVQRFRLSEVPGAIPEEPLMKIWIRESKLLRGIRLSYRYWVSFRQALRAKFFVTDVKVDDFVKEKAPRIYQTTVKVVRHLNSPVTIKVIQFSIVLSIFLFVGYGAFKLLTVLIRVSFATWMILLRDTLWTFLRVVAALFLSTLWAVPVGIWIGTSPKRMRIAQPFIQILASFPAPMLYPVALGFLFWLGMSFNWASMCLMLLGVQWYVLFNVLAGALRIPRELSEALSLMKASRWHRWHSLYLPSVFPPLVTGWITAAGGAWNASVVAEYIYYQRTILKAEGLGATLSVATANQDFNLFAASLTTMIFVVILLNRTVWSKVSDLAQTRFRMDL